MSLKRLNEEILMFINDTKYMYEMSTPRGQVKNKIANLGEQVITHIFKILLYPDTQTVRHWEAEINKWLADVVKRKPKGGRLTPKLVYKWMIARCDLDEVPGYVYYIMSCNPKKEYNADKLYEQMKKVLYKLIEETLLLNLDIDNIDEIIKEVIVN